jgi:hypothetical protein
LRDRRRVADTATRELVRLARNVLFTRKDAYIHLSNAEAAVEVREAEARGESLKNFIPA